MRHIAFFSCILLCAGLSWAQSKGKITIQVKDARTTRPVADATLFLSGIDDSGRTDKNGEYLFDSIAPGLYSLTVKAEGYEAFTEPTISIRTGINPSFTALLSKQTTVQELEKMVIIGHASSEKKLPSQTNSVSRLSNYEISNVPGTANDINRVLSSHPATVSSIGSGFDNSLFVRGGHSYENVYLIDGIEMENASHFSSVYRSGGAVGFVNSVLVKQLDFYIGSFPAYLPSKLSSVIDVSLRNGSMMEPRYQIDLNMSGLGLTLERPITKKASLLANLRFADLRLLESFLTNEGTPTYGDALIKTVITPNDKNLLRFTTVGAIDNYIEEYNYNVYSAESNYDQWIYQAGAIGAWEYNNGKFKNEVSISGAYRDIQEGEYLDHFSDTVHLDTFTYNYSHYNRENTLIDTLWEPTDTMISHSSSYVDKSLSYTGERRWHASVKNDFTLFLRADDLLNAGISAGNYNYAVENRSGIESYQFGYTFDDEGVVPVDDLIWSYTPFDVDSAIDVRRFSGYAEYVFSQGPLKAVAGLRGDYYTALTDYGISPRLGVRSQFPGIGAFSLSGGLYYQFPADFSGLVQDMVAADPNFNFANRAPLHQAKLQRCWQASAGFDKEFAGSHLLTIEGYYKWYDREYPFVYPENRRYGEGTDDGFRWRLDDPRGEKKAYGIEFTFQKKKYDHLYYSMSGSLFDVKNKYTDGKWYNDENNVRATVGLSVGWNSRHHGISLRGSGSGGRPYSPITYNNKYDFYEIDTTKAYYSEFLDPIFSLNLRYSFKIYPRWGNITGYVEVWNLLNYTPTVERYLYSGRGYVDYENQGIMPVGGVTVDF